MPGHVKVSGAWKALDGIHVRVSGTWKAVQVGYIKVSGAWKEFYTAATVTLSGETIADSDSGGATVSIFFRSDGTVDKKEGASTSQIDSATDWIIPNGSADSTYEVRCTNIAGDTWSAEAAAEGTWVGLGSDREWRFTDSIPGGYSLTCDFEIRKDGGAALASTGYTFNLTVSP